MTRQTPKLKTSSTPKSKKITRATHSRGDQQKTKTAGKKTQTKKATNSSSTTARGSKATPRKKTTATSTSPTHKTPPSRSTRGVKKPPQSTTAAKSDDKKTKQKSNASGQKKMSGKRKEGKSKSLTSALLPTAFHLPKFNSRMTQKAIHNGELILQKFEALLERLENKIAEKL